MITWILIANAAAAKIITSENLRQGGWQLLREFMHPDSRKKVTELISDKPGHYKTDMGARGSYSKNDPKEVVAEHFAIQLAHELKAGWDKNQYDQLVVVTPAHFYGLMKKHLSKNLATIMHVAKDYTKYTLSELTTGLQEQLFK